MAFSFFTILIWETKSVLTWYWQKRCAVPNQHLKKSQTFSCFLHLPPFFFFLMKYLLCFESTWFSVLPLRHVKCLPFFWFSFSVYFILITLNVFGLGQEQFSLSVTLLWEVWVAASHFRASFLPSTWLTQPAVSVHTCWLYFIVSQ